MILAPAHFHGNFIGTLDEKRSELVLCASIFHYEFSGNESVDQFHEMNVKKVHIDIWTRKPVPKVFIRFNNPKTRAGTRGKKYVLTSDSYLMSEVYHLNGIENGFIDIINYADEELNIISNSQDVYQLNFNKDKLQVNTADLSKKISYFLTR